MKKALLFLLSISCLQGCSKDGDPQNAPQKIATAALYSLTTTAEAPVLIGTANFTELNGTVSLIIEVEGLTPGGTHAIHLHDGSCELPGMHWNGGSDDRYCDVNDMGKAWGRPYLGDIGNISIGANGRGSLQLSTRLWAVGDGSPLNVLGKALMLHAEAEDFDLECDPNHQNHPHTNAKIACGEVVMNN